MKPYKYPHAAALTLVGIAGLLIVIPSLDTSISDAVALGMALILAPLCIGAAFSILDRQQGSTKLLNHVRVAYPTNPHKRSTHHV